MRSAVAVVLVGLAPCLAACGAPGRRVASVAPSPEDAVAALADSILAAARARDADRFAAYFQAGEGLVYVLNTRQLTSRTALRDAFRAMLGRQRQFDPRWTERRVQMLAPGAAEFTGAFRTTARDTSGAAWAAEGVVTFAARLDSGAWRVVNWHTSEREVAP